MNTRTNYTRRQALKMGVGSLASIPLVGLAGCDTPVQQVSTSNTASLRMFFWGGATRDKLTTKAINLFHQSNPAITITSKYAAHGPYFVSLDAQIAAGTAPDLIQMDMRYIAHYVRLGALLDLTQYIYNQNIDLSDFDPIVLNSSKVNNTLYGISLGSNYECMYYDKTRLENAGIGPLPQNLTWDTFTEYTTELSKALGNGVYGTSDFSGNYDAFEIWIRQRGKELYTKEGALAFEEADTADWYAYWDNLRKKNSCPPSGVQATLDLSETPADASVVKGKAVFSHIFSNQLEAYQAATPHPLQLIPYPKGNGPGLYLKASQLLSISANTKYPDQAASFTSFAVRDPGAVKALGFERGVPGSASSLAVLKPQLTTTQQAIVDFMNQVATTGNSRPKEVLEPPSAGKIAANLLQISLQIGTGKTSVTNGAHEFYLGAQKATA